MSHNRDKDLTVGWIKGIYDR